MNKKKSQGVILIVIGVVLLVLIFLLRDLTADEMPLPATTPPPGATVVPETTLTPGDSDTDIANDLDSLDLGDLEKEFQSLDADVNNL